MNCKCGAHNDNLMKQYELAMIVVGKLYRSAATGADMPSMDEINQVYDFERVPCTCRHDNDNAYTLEVADNE